MLKSFKNENIKVRKEKNLEKYISKLKTRAYVTKGIVGRLSSKVSLQEHTSKTHTNIIYMENALPQT